MKTLQGSLEIKGVFVQQSEDVPTRFRLGRLNYEPFEGKFGDVEVTADAVRIEALRSADKATQATSVVAEATFAKGLIVKLPGVGVTIDELELPRGFRLKRDGEILVPTVVLRGLVIHLDQVGGGGGKENTERSWKLTNYEFLDSLTGHLHVDLMVDIDGPLIGNRTETHNFRIGIRDGSIDYEALEDDVAWLERSVLDIEVVDDNLVLERSLPLIPWSTKALLVWPLDSEGLELAMRNRVKLRTLLYWHVPEEERGRRKQGSSIRLNQLGFRNIDVALDVAGTVDIDFGAAGCIRLGSPETGIQGLHITGSLEYEKDAAPTRTLFRAVLESLPCALDNLRLGSLRVSADTIDIGDIDEVTLAWDGLSPGAVDAQSATMTASGVRIAMPPKP